MFRQLQEFLQPAFVTIPEASPAALFAIIWGTQRSNSAPHAQVTGFEVVGDRHSTLVSSLVDIRTAVREDSDATW